MNSFRRHWAVLLSILFLNLPLFASLPTSSTAPFKEESLRLIKNGNDSQLPFYDVGAAFYLGIEQLARLAEAQLRWQAVTEQACLSNSQGLLCFNWADSRVENNGRVTQNQIALRFENNQLFVPMSYVTTKEFQSFADSDFTWNAKTKTIQQTASIRLGQPEVERKEGTYQMRIDTPEKGAQYMIEKSDKKIWIRFVRAHSEGSQVFNGDDVIREVKIIQRRRSADLIVSLGDRAGDSDVYFDDDKKSLFIDVEAVSSDALIQKSVVRKKAPIKIAKKQAVPVRKAPVVVGAPVSVPLPTIASETKPVKRAAKEDRKGMLTIVVDAGHGGMDAGAIGPRGTLEKDINLEVAKLLAKQLKKEKNVQVIMTRDSDEFISLNGRTDIANAAKADLFVSIHCNSSLSSKNLGFETYFLSPDATDKAAEAVARVENSVVALEAKKGAGSSKLESLLASMAVHDQINESSRFASIMVRSVKQITGQDKAAVKEADFFVLRGAQMPAVLVELEYLSHPVSESKLRSSRYRGHLVKGLVDGILTFDRQLRRERDSKAVQITPVTNKTNR